MDFKVSIGSDPIYGGNVRNLSLLSAPQKFQDNI